MNRRKASIIALLIILLSIALRSAFSLWQDHQARQHQIEHTETRQEIEARRKELEKRLDELEARKRELQQNQEQRALEIQDLEQEIEEFKHSTDELP